MGVLLTNLEKNMNKSYCLSSAIEIAKEYASSNNPKINIEDVLRNVYNTLKELDADASR